MDIQDAGNSESPGAPTSRTTAFSEGASPGTLEASARENAATPHTFTPTSVLQPYINSPNGLGTKDASRMLVGGGLMPSSNGSAEDTWEKARPIRSNRLSAVPSI